MSVPQNTSSRKASWNSLEMQFFRPQTRPTESETALGPEIHAVPALQVILIHAQVGGPCRGAKNAESGHLTVIQMCP